MKKFLSLEIARNILNEVIFNNVAFSNCVKNYSIKYQLNKEEFAIANVLTGCELRHHLVFEEVVKRQFNHLPNQVALSLYIALANNLFAKKVDEKEVFEFVIQTFLQNNIDFNTDEIKDFIDEYKDTSSLMPSEYEKNSYDFLSLRFNTPKWLVKMWSKSFGDALTYKILKANSKAPLKTVRISPLADTSLIDQDEVFEKTFVDGVLSYKGKSPIKKQKYFNQNLIFPMKMAIKHIFDNQILDSFKGIAVYQGYSNNAYLEAIFQTSIHTDIEIMVSNYQDYYEAKKYIQAFGLDKARLYNCDAKSIITCISNPVDTFIVCPKSSNFDLLRNVPDYFLKFKPENFDNLIKEQYDTLCECSNFVDKDGQIMYIVPTLSVKEGPKLVREFLKNHKDFVLSSERQYFPFDPYESCLYFALLKKEGGTND